MKKDEPLQVSVPQDLKQATVRFAGDSGDGMQLTGSQFAQASAAAGHSVVTLPEYPSDIRAPANSIYGVSGFQLQLSSGNAHTPGEKLDALVAMNPAALRVNLKDLKRGGILIANEDAFTARNLKTAGYAANPLEDGMIREYRSYTLPMTTATLAACEEVGLTGPDAARCKNFYALGVVCYLYSLSLDPIISFLERKFRSKEQIRDANIRSLKAGYIYSENRGLFPHTFRVAHAKLPPGTYREIQGNEAAALGLVVASRLAGKELFYGSYPITPASEILQELVRMRRFGVKAFQAEDEIAAVTSSIGAAYTGALAATATSGPGLDLKSEGLGLAVMLELPLIVIDVQRAGPSTGLPTKPEQSDLLQALFGRHGDCPVPVLAALSPSDCFDMALLAARIAVKYMTPVMVLTDGYIANSSEPWCVPDLSSLEPIEVVHPTEPNSEEGEYHPYKRNEDLSRPWALPGTPGLMHRVGGLEKANPTGNVSYDPENHQQMVEIRQKKIEKVAESIPLQEIEGDEDAELLVVGWGSSSGAIREALEQLREEGHKVAAICIRYLNPFPPNLGEILKKFPRILVCELNMGQLLWLIRARFLVDATGLNKVQGRPFMASDITDRARKLLGPVSSERKEGAA